MNEHAGQILVVDDEPQVSNVLARHIRGAGFQVEIAGSAEEAINLSDTESFDLILIDIVLPGQSGFYALQTLSRKCDADIFMMTGYGADEIRKDAELLGAAGVIQKPVELEALSKIISGLKQNCGVSGACS